MYLNVKKVAAVNTVYSSYKYCEQRFFIITYGKTRYLHNPVMK